MKLPLNDFSAHGTAREGSWLYRTSIKRSATTTKTVLGFANERALAERTAVTVTRVVILMWGKVVRGAMMFLKSDS